MATSRATIDHILDLLAGARSDPGEVSARRMFGEYAFDLSGKVVALVCDDRLFLKPTPGLLALVDGPAADREMGSPYPGAKPHLVGDGLLDDPDALCRALDAIARDLPAPKLKPKRQGTGPAGKGRSDGLDLDP